MTRTTLPYAHRRLLLGCTLRHAARPGEPWRAYRMLALADAAEALAGRRMLDARIALSDARFYRRAERRERDAAFWRLFGRGDVAAVMRP